MNRLRSPGPALVCPCPLHILHTAHCPLNTLQTTHSMVLCCVVIVLKKSGNLVPAFYSGFGQKLNFRLHKTQKFAPEKSSSWNKNQFFQICVKYLLTTQRSIYIGTLWFLDPALVCPCPPAYCPSVPVFQCSSVPSTTQCRGVVGTITRPIGATIGRH